MVMIFKSHGLWKFVEKGVTVSNSKKEKTEGSLGEEDDEKTVATYMQDAKALGIIQNAVSDQIFPRIANADSAKMAWDLLYGEYHGGDQVRSVKLQNLRREFEYARMRDDETLSGYLTRLNELINQMKTFGEILSNERLVQKVLISLSKPYDPICLVIENTKCLETVELQEVVAILKSQEQRFDLHSVDTTERAFASLSVTQKGQTSSNAQSGTFKSYKHMNSKGKKWESKSKYKGKPKCYNCDKFGHWAKECTAGKVIQKANCANQTEVTRNLFYVSNAISENKMNGNWYIDNLLVNIRTNVAGKVQMPTGELIKVAGMGSLEIETNKGKKYIREVMHLPRLKENLLSVGQMDEHGYFLLFGGNMCSVFDVSSLENLVIKVRKKENRCYPLSLLENT
ncbi:unnamed protein product [Malus baccata var. baccata]